MLHIERKSSYDFSVQTCFQNIVEYSYEMLINL